MLQHKNQSVSAHDFSMVPRPDIPRSTIMRQTRHLTTFDAGFLVPFYVDEVLPGDSFKLQATLFARLATPIYPVMDNLYLDTFFFFIPNRLLWSHWVNFMGEQTNPADSISYTIPITSVAAGYSTCSLQDYMGLINVGQQPGGTQTHSCLPLRAYNITWNTWFRDENLQNSVGTGNTNLPGDIGDGPDGAGNYQLLRRGKRHDYFTSSLPWPQKGGVSVTLPLGSQAPVKGIGFQTLGGAPSLATNVRESGGGTRSYTFGTASFVGVVAEATSASTTTSYPTIYADLSTATAATINQIRQAVTIQRLLERNARSGTRYTEYVLGAFGVKSPDARLQRPEFLGGATQPINITPIAQTGQTGLTGGTTPIGTLSGAGTTLGNSGFTQSFTEHGYILGLMSVRADLTYQQGMRKMWSRSTLYDFYDPAFANLGEQAVLNKEIYSDGTANDNLVWGYQERWAEMRYLPTMITGQFRSTFTTPLDAWHLAQRFTTLPLLNSTFIQDTPPMTRVLAIGAASVGQQFIGDTFIKIQTARALPLYSVPGLTRF